MSIIPIITFKAGICDVDASTRPYKIKPQARQGYIYLYAEDELIHFCWRERSVPLDSPELDLVMVPTDGNFVPYDSKASGEASSKTNGRIFVLKFGSSSQRHLFWLQSKPQARSGDPSWFSPRDLKIGEIVNSLLQGEDVDVTRELARIQNNTDDSRRDGDDGDETMEDVEGHGDPNTHHRGSTGGAGPDATGGDIRQEGEDSREGGGDGARAASSATPDAATAVRNFLNSLSGGAGAGVRQQAQGKLYPLLSDLLDTPTTIPVIEEAPESHLNKLLNLLPPTVLVLAQRTDSGDATDAEPTPEAATAAIATMSIDQKRTLLKKVLRSPQFAQSLASLTVALRDGGLPSIAATLNIKVENNGLVRGGTMPLGGGEAVEAFVEGVKKSIKDEKK